MKTTSIILALLLLVGCKTIQTIDPDTGEVTGETTEFDPAAASGAAAFLPQPFGALALGIIPLLTTVINRKEDE